MDEQKEPMDQIPAEPVAEPLAAEVPEVPVEPFTTAETVAPVLPVPPTTPIPDAGAYQAPQQQYSPNPQQPYGQAPQQPYGQAQQPYTQAQPPYGQAPQQPYGQPGGYQQPYAATSRTDKDRIVAGILAILLGSLGIHKFYLGYRNEGLIMLLVSIIGSCVTFGVSAAVVGIIGIVEGVIYLTKSQAEFEQMYVFNRKGWF